MAAVTIGEWLTQFGAAGVGFQDFDFWELHWATVVEQTPSLYALDGRDPELWDPPVLFKFYGSGLTYDASGGIAGGVVTGWDVLMGRDEDVKQLSVAGLSLPAAAVADAFANSTYITPAVFGGDDSITGSSGVDSLWGFNGNDTITGGGGGDSISGGGPAGVFSLPDPADHLYGYVLSAADGSNYLRGEAGNDLIQGGGGFDDINGNAGDDTAYGGPGDDWVVGGKDNDVLSGDDGSDIVLGNLGNDTLDGGGGADIVRGGQGDDVIAGGAGDDYVSGDRGDDTVSGGAGADRFHAFGEAGVDRVTDFHFGEGDRVMLDPGSVYAVAQVDADTVISLSGGARMILVGVQLSTVSGAWIFEG